MRPTLHLLEASTPHATDAGGSDAETGCVTSLAVLAAMGTVSRDFCFMFFHESSSPKPLKITLGSFQFFSKIRGDIHMSRCTTCINYTGGKFSTGINNTGGKFATGTWGVVDAGNGNNIRLFYTLK